MVCAFGLHPLVEPGEHGVVPQDVVRRLQDPVVFVLEEQQVCMIGDRRERMLV